MGKPLTWTCRKCWKVSPPDEAACIYCHAVRSDGSEEAGFIWWSKVIVGSALTLFVLWALCVLIMAMLR